jgi:hypothetical protein
MSASRQAQARASKQLAVVAVMTGGQVVPPSTSSALGMAFLTFDNFTKRLCYSTSSQLLSNETEAHLNGDAQVGQTSALLYDLTPLRSRKVTCIPSPLKPNEEVPRKRGRMHMAGEIRGQIPAHACDAVAGA